MRVSRADEAVRVELERYEVELLTSLSRGLREVLSSGDTADPVVSRLFPRVSADDDVDAEVRRLIYDDLLRARLEGLDAIGAMLARGESRRGRLRLELDEDDATLVLGVLNDVRLALGARVGIDQLDRTEVGADDPAAATLAVMDHLAWFQEQLLVVLDPPAVAE